jgi:type II secretory pathway pseudopilin PulG
MPETDRPGLRARAGFTAIELMVVVSVIIMLVAMTVPSIFPAIRKGRVHDAANAILKVASQARQLARSRTMPTPASAALFYGVAVVVPTTGAAYAVLIYDQSLPNGSAAGAVGRLADGSTTNYLSKQTFNANVMPFTNIMVNGGGGSKTIYGLQPRGTMVGWYYQYRTGFVLRNDQPPVSGNQILAQLGSIGTLPVPANPATGAPAVAAYTPTTFGVCSLDQQYVVAMAIYSIGLANAQDLF